MINKLKAFFLLIFPAQVLFLSSSLNLLQIESIGYFSNGKWYLLFPVILAFTLLTLLLAYLKRIKKQKAVSFIQYFSILFVLFQIAIGYNKYGYFAEFVFIGLLLFPLVHSYLAKFKDIIVYVSVSYLALNIYYISKVTIFNETQEAAGYERFEYSPKGRDTLPNIYHILLDEASFESFEEIVKEKKLKHFSSFDVFSNITTNYSFSKGSAFSTFTSKYLNEGDSVTSKLNNAFNGGTTLLSKLKGLGYETLKVGNLPDIIKSDHRYRFEDFDYDEPVYKYKALNNTIVFLQLFKSKYTPFFRAPFLNQYLYPYTIYSEKYGFQKFLEQEKDLSGKGRYSLIYLTSPHFPYLLDESCNHEPILNYTTYESSYKCSLKMINQFLGKLKELNRYNDSLIIVHSDHGKDYGRKLGNLGNRHHPMFLFKRIGQAKGKTLSTAGELRDLPKTVLFQIDPEAGKEFGGSNLYDMESKEFRHFYQLNPFGRWKKGFHYKLDKEMNAEYMGIFSLEK
ncbi:MAG: hypothetical protein CME64_03485 [Halobacteriovoraceae bacterium]|nr:hypothetical protein [Halobacteriovoraceae bacterium]